jgi:putative alpha-1,2-mannosidase
MGIFPHAGQDISLIGSPAYRRTTLHLAGGKDFVIEVQKLSPDKIYVAAATLNDRPIDRAWLRHREIAAGRRLVPAMSGAPGHWARQDPPPNCGDIETGHSADCRA